MSQYGYYFRKPKTEIAKDVVTWLMIGGIVAVVATSPYFIQGLVRAFPRWKRYKSKQLSNVFYRLKREGYITIERRDYDIFLSLTKEGRKKAGRFQINDLRVKTPKKWDKKWRIFIFDIAQRNVFVRNALRGFLKRLKFYPLQKSVWIHAFECKDELNLLKAFFGLKDQDARLLVADDIGEDGKVKEFFGV